MTEFFELLKYTIPASIVFAASYFTLKSYLDAHYRDLALTQRIEAQKLTLPVRLQAYERLILLCDRVTLPHLLLRVRSSAMTVAELQGTLLIAISQEFDHNTSQQLYVSDTLWQIINLAKGDTMALVTKSAEDLDPAAPDELLISRLFATLDQLGNVTTLQKAQIAIRTEAGQLF